MIAPSIEPAGVAPAITGVESGSAAPLIGRPPGVELHVLLIVEPPRGLAGDTLPVTLPLLAADAANMLVPAMLPMVDIAAGVDGVPWPADEEQVTTVPGVVGSSARGTGASVVSGTPGWVSAENGPGPVSGDDTMVPGVVDSPIAVVPMVDTCATQGPPNSSSATVRARE